MTTHDNDTCLDDKAADEAAFAWLCRVRADECSAAEREEFREWHADTRNAAAYARATELKSALTAISTRPAISALRESIIKKSDARLTEHRQNKGCGSRTDTKPNIVNLDAVRQTEGSPARKNSEKLTTKDSRKGMGRWWGFAGGVSIAAAVAIFAVLPFMENTHQTGVGEIRTLVLDDQTKVTIDTNTKLRVAFSESARVIHLSKGQAFFDVAKNPSRPFTVDTGDDKVTAVGTAFSVRNIDNEFTVVLTEGIVDITDGDEKTDTTRLKPGQKWHESEGRSGRKSEVSDLQEQLSWMNGTLLFKSSKLSKVIEEVNRYSEVKVIMKGNELEDSEINAIYHIGKTESFATAVQKMLDLDVEYDVQGNIILSRAGAS